MSVINDVISSIQSTYNLDKEQALKAYGIACGDEELMHCELFERLDELLIKG